MKATIKFAIASATACFLLAGCGSSSDTVHSAKWYAKHHEARAAMLKQCASMPMKEAKGNKNCDNASSSYQYSGFHGVRMIQPTK